MLSGDTICLFDGFCTQIVYNYFLITVIDILQCLHRHLYGSCAGVKSFLRDLDSCFVFHKCTEREISVSNKFKITPSLSCGSDESNERDR